MSDYDVPRMPRRATRPGDYDPRVMGLWKVGRVIGQGATGQYLQFFESARFFSCLYQVACA
jgi:hypothetical protein